MALVERNVEFQPVPHTAGNQRLIRFFVRKKEDTDLDATYK